MSESGDMSDSEEVPMEEAGSSPSAEEVVLLPADILGAELSEPLEKHTVAALHWWLLCRGIKVFTSVRKKDLLRGIAMMIIEVNVVLYRTS